MDRARFDHGAHVLQRGCLDCHTRIPFEEYLSGDGPVDAALDNAAIQNLPADRCLTCHEFYPDTNVRNRLLR